MNTDLLFENARLQGRVITLEAEVKCLEAVVRAHQRLDCLQVKDLKAENARLKAEVQRLEEIVGSDAIDRKYGMCCDASDEVARLKAEVERLSKKEDSLHDLLNQYALDDMRLTAQVERLTKAGDWMMADLFSYQKLDGLKSVKNWTAAKEGKDKP